MWFGEKIPSMAYGTRGLVYAFIEIKGPKKDQHSGYGGSFREPMTDLVNILSKSPISVSRSNIKLVILS